MIDWFKDKKLSIDPRTKVVLLLLCVFSAMLAPSLQYELVLIMIIGIFGVCCKKWKYAFKGIIFYLLIYMFTKYSLQGTTQGRYLTGGVPPIRFSM